MYRFKWLSPTPRLSSISFKNKIPYNKALHLYTESPEADVYHFNYKYNMLNFRDSSELFTNSAAKYVYYFSILFILLICFLRTICHVIVKFLGSLT